MFDNIHGTHRADTFLINEFSVKIECTPTVEMPTDVAMKHMTVVDHS